jgi:hypothetical protein
MYGHFSVIFLSRSFLFCAKKGGAVGKDVIVYSKVGDWAASDVGIASFFVLRKRRGMLWEKMLLDTAKLVTGRRRMLVFSDVEAFCVHFLFCTKKKS